MANSPYVRLASEREAAQKEIATINAELAKATARLAEAEAIIAELSNEMAEGMSVCPFCRLAMDLEPHAPDCRIRRFMDGRYGAPTEQAGKAVTK